MDPRSEVAKRTKTNFVVFCREQLLNLVGYGETPYIEGWPSGAVSVIVEPIEDEDGAPAGVWRTADEEEEAGVTEAGTTDVGSTEIDDESDDEGDPMQID